MEKAKGSRMSISVLFVTGDADALQTRVAARSIVERKAAGTAVDFRFVCASLSAANAEAFERLAGDGVKVQVVYAEEGRFLDGQATLPTQERLRQALPELCEDLDKAVYLSGNVLVRDDLSELFAVDLGEKLVGAVRDPVALLPDDLNSHAETSRKVGLFFYPGVMVLNLRAMRGAKAMRTLALMEKDMPMGSHYAEQETWNLALDGQVMALPLRWNVRPGRLGMVRKACGFQTLNKVYGTAYVGMKDLLEDAGIVDWTDSKQPWQSPFAPFAEEWFRVYRGTPGEHEVPDYEKILAGTRFTVSLTSYPPRIAYVAAVIESLKRQTFRPGRIVLYLAKGEFPGREADLPAPLRAQLAAGDLELHWGEQAGLKPHKKYVFAMKEYPDDVVITVDDDVVYPPTALAELVVGYLLFPRAVSARRAHLMTFDGERVAKYNDWLMSFHYVTMTPSMQLVATGVGGVLYPPHLLPAETLDAGLISEYAVGNDDLWLKAMETIAGIPTVVVTERVDLISCPGSQEVGLFVENVKHGRNDRIWAVIGAYVDGRFGRQGVLDELLRHPAHFLDLGRYETLLDVLRFAHRKTILKSEYRRMLVQAHADGRAKAARARKGTEPRWKRVLLRPWRVLRRVLGGG